MLSDYALFLQNQTVFAIKAPENTYIEVPDPDEVSCLVKLVLIFYNALESDWLAAFIHNQDIGYPQRQYKMIVRSHNGPIDLYLLRYVYYVISHAWKYFQVLEFF